MDDTKGMFTGSFENWRNPVEPSQESFRHDIYVILGGSHGYRLCCVIFDSVEHGIDPWKGFVNLSYCGDLFSRLKR